MDNVFENKCNCAKADRETLSKQAVKATKSNAFLSARQY